jgi:hypothetical protein
MNTSETMQHPARRSITHILRKASKKLFDILPNIYRIVNIIAALVVAQFEGNFL